LTEGQVLLEGSQEGPPEEPEEPLLPEEPEEDPLLPEDPEDDPLLPEDPGESIATLFTNKTKIKKLASCPGYVKFKSSCKEKALCLYLSFYTFLSFQLAGRRHD